MTRLSVCGILASLIFFVVGWKLMMASGVALDNMIHVPGFFEWGVWVVFFGSMVMLFLTWLYGKLQWVPFWLALTIFVLYVVYSLIVSIGWKISFEELRGGRELMEAVKIWVL